MFIWVYRYVLKAGQKTGILYSNMLDAILINVLVNYTEFFASEREVM